MSDSESPTSAAMTDYFALLDEPRRPWLEPAALKEKFLALSTLAHPDRVHHLSEAEQERAQGRYTDLNAAYQCLREPRDRLRHLLELELGAVAKEVQQVPPELMDCFVEVGQGCRQADAMIAEKAGTTSPLLRVRWFERGQDLTEKLEALRRKLDERCAQLLDELKRLDASWQTGTGSAPERMAQLGRLEVIYRLLSFYTRWTRQLQERILQLAL